MPSYHPDSWNDWNYTRWEAAVAAEEQHMLTKMLVVDAHGGRENLWARNLDGGLALLCNAPLYPKFRFQDVVSYYGFGRPTADKVIFRPFPMLLRYTYTALRDDAVDKARRDVLFDAMLALKVHPGFFCAGDGPKVIADALVATAIPITRAWIEVFDAPSDKYNNVQIIGELP